MKCNQLRLDNNKLNALPDSVWGHEYLFIFGRSEIMMKEQNETSLHGVKIFGCAA